MSSGKWQPFCLGFNGPSECPKVVIFTIADILAPKGHPPAHRWRHLKWRDLTKVRSSSNVNYKLPIWWWQYFTQFHRKLISYVALSGDSSTINPINMHKVLLYFTAITDHYDPFTHIRQPWKCCHFNAYYQLMIVAEPVSKSRGSDKKRPVYTAAQDNKTRNMCTYLVMYYISSDHGTSSVSRCLNKWYVNSQTYILGNKI